MIGILAGVRVLKKYRLIARDGIPVQGRIMKSSWVSHQRFLKHVYLQVAYQAEGIPRTADCNFVRFIGVTPAIGEAYSCLYLKDEPETLYSANRNENPGRFGALILISSGAVMAFVLSLCLLMTV